MNTDNGDRDMSKHYTLHDGLEGYVMFGYFSFDAGKLHLGQCESVKVSEVNSYRDILASRGYTQATYKYVDGKPELVA